MPSDASTDRAALDPETSRRRLTVALPVSGVLLAAAALVIGLVSGGAPANAGDGHGGPGTGDPSEASGTPSPRPAPEAAPAPAAVDTFDRNAHSLDDPMSIWVVVNRDRPLNPEDFVPPDLVDVPVAHTWEPQLRQEASDAVVAMFQAAADEAGFFLASNSAYRSFGTQVDLYGDGDDPTTAPPGRSEHQTGLGIDIGTERGCTFECMEDSDEGQWLRDNAYRFGFILRYPADKVDVTGYPHEAWHYRYIGVELATKMRETGYTTLEEFFGLPAAPMP